jgi:hypothetical protein
MDTQICHGVKLEFVFLLDRYAIEWSDVSDQTFSHIVDERQSHQTVPVYHHIWSVRLV